MKKHKAEHKCKDTIKECEHCLHHCKKCDVVYCCKCDMEWSRDIFTTYTYPTFTSNPDFYVAGGTRTTSNTIQTHKHKHK